MPDAPEQSPDDSTSPPAKRWQNLLKPKEGEDKGDGAGQASAPSAVRWSKLAAERKPVSFAQTQAERTSAGTGQGARPDPQSEHALSQVQAAISRALAGTPADERTQAAETLAADVWREVQALQGAPTATKSPEAEEEKSPARHIAEMLVFGNKSKVTHEDVERIFGQARGGPEH